MTAIGDTGAEPEQTAVAYRAAAPRRPGRGERMNAATQPASAAAAPAAADRGERAWSIEVRRDPRTGNAVVTLDGFAIYEGAGDGALKVAEREASRARRDDARARRWRRKRRGDPPALRKAPSRREGAGA